MNFNKNMDTSSFILFETSKQVFNKFIDTDLPDEHHDAVLSSCSTVVYIYLQTEVRIYKPRTGKEKTYWTSRN